MRFFFGIQSLQPATQNQVRVEKQAADGRDPRREEEQEQREEGEEEEEV